MRRAVLVLVVCVSLVSCVPKAPHRLVRENAQWRLPVHDDVMLPESAMKPQRGSAEWERLKRTSLERYATFDVGIVELDDDGQLWSDAQQGLVLEHVRKVAMTEGATIVVFIHGWHHSAAPDDGNLESFREVLQKIGSRGVGLRCPPEEKPTNRVVGVYVGWRGENLSVPGLNLATIWSRKKAAQRIGGRPHRWEQRAVERGEQKDTQLTVLLERLAQIASDANASAVASGRAFTSLVTTGHSLGGAMLLSATDRIVMGDRERLPEGEPVRRIGDLVVLLNPAIEARRYVRFQRSLQNTYGPEQSPVLVTISSRGDTPNRVAFTLSRVPVTLVYPRYWIDFPSSLFTLGFRRSMRTHELSGGAEEDEDIDYYRDDLSNAITDPARFDLSAPGKYNSMMLTQWEWKGQRVKPYAPFLVVYADNEIIADHNDIFGNVVEFLLPLVTTVQRKNVLSLCAAR